MRHANLSPTVAMMVSAVVCSFAHAGIVMEDKPNPEKKGASVMTRVDGKNSQGPGAGPVDRQLRPPLGDVTNQKAKGTLIDPDEKSPKDPGAVPNVKK
jgi:hypothetical protein